MHPAIATLPPHTAFQMLFSADLFHRWLAINKIEYARELLADLSERSDEPEEYPGALRRRDGTELRAFVERAPGLPPRLREVAKLCLDEGYSLTECATRLDLSRETVRVHLRRLRTIARRTGCIRQRYR